MCIIYTSLLSICGIMFFSKCGSAYVLFVYTILQYVYLCKRLKTNAHMFNLLSIFGVVFCKVCLSYNQYNSDSETGNDV